jgi:hypothetical protein
VAWNGVPPPTCWKPASWPVVSRALFSRFSIPVTSVAEMS